MGFENLIISICVLTIFISSFFIIKSYRVYKKERIILRISELEKEIASLEEEKRRIETEKKNVERI